MTLVVVCRRGGYGVVAVSVLRIKSHQALDNGSSARDALGNERADEFARMGYEASVCGEDGGRSLGDLPDIVHGLRRSWRGAEPFRHALEWYEDRWRCSRCLVVRPAGRCGDRHGAASKCPGSLPRVTSVLEGWGWEWGWSGVGGRRGWEGVRG